MNDRPKADVANLLAEHRKFLIATAALVAAFSWQLFQLAKFSLESPLFSHALLVPVISAYLVWQMRANLPAPSPADPRLAIAPFMAGGACLVVWLTSPMNLEDRLAYSILALVLFFGGVCALFLGRQTVRAIVFPLGFLLLMAPFPTSLTEWIESVLQDWSALSAYVFFSAAGTSVFRHETFLQLPGMKLLVAPECSGVHSTLALFITSLLAGHLFLKSPWRRTVLALVVFPVAIFRNGLRIFVVGELCVRVGPEMIDSYIHRKGGPIFFAISLIPFCLALWFLIKSEQRKTPAPS